MAKWLYEKEMEQMLGLIFKTHNELGIGWSEEMFHQALVYFTKKDGIPVKSKPRHSLFHRGIKIHTFEPDIIVWDKIILELKVLFDYRGNKFPSINHAQLFHYLKFFRMELGALINFAHPKVGIKRILYEPSDYKIDEDYERMMPYVQETDKEILRDVQHHIKNIGKEYGLGYPETLYRKLIATELTHHHIACVSELNIPVKLDNHKIGEQNTPYLLIADRFLLHIRSSIKSIPTHDYIKTKTYLRTLGLNVGWIINFGQDKLQIHATATN